MEPEPHRKPIRYLEIDLLRFLAAFSVILYHYTYQGYAVFQNSVTKVNPIAFPALEPITKYGYLGVELFFIISGYVILLSAQGKTVKQFAISRIVRLYPAFWVACTLTFLIEYIWGAKSSDIHMSPNLHATAAQYIANLSMLQDFVGIPHIDGVYWSLTIEITFYFLISILISYNILQHINLCIAMWLGFAAIPSFLHVSGSAFDILFFPSYAPYFAAGMLFYLLQQPQGRSWQRIALLAVSYLLSIRAAVNGSHLVSTVYHTAFSAKITATIVTVFFIIFALVAFRKIDFSRYMWLSWLGSLTYPVYLLHSNIGFIIFHRIGGILNKYLLLGGLLLLMMVIAYIIHVYIERRYSKLLGQKIQQLLANH